MHMRAAIELHLAGLREDGLPVPEGRGKDEAGAEILELA
jgi:predicted RNase H-like HicB family nuclease